MRSFAGLSRAGIALALFMVGGIAALAEDAAPAANPTVATVNGVAITKDDLNAAYFEIGSQLAGRPPQQVYQALLDFAIDIRLSEKAALDAGLDKQPDVAKRLEVARLHTLYAEYYQKLIGEAVTPDAIKKQYDAEMAKFDATEIHAAHILVGSEDEAKAIIADLDKGGDFAAIAKEKSTDTGSAQQGGDLGFFGHGAMIPEFETAAFALKDGTYTKTPVKSQFGWHVIKTIERRKGTPPTLEAETPRIKEELVSQTVTAARKALRDKAKIEYPKPATPAPEAAPATGATPAPVNPN